MFDIWNLNKNILNIEPTISCVYKYIKYRAINVNELKNLIQNKLKIKFIISNINN